MIITFKLTDTTASSGDYLIVDNCTDLRTTIVFKDKYEAIKDVFDKLTSMQDYVCKEFRLTVDVEIKQDLYLLEFNSNGKQYFIITEQTVYIANDSNKTIQIIN